jgi:hypothetical protein
VFLLKKITYEVTYMHRFALSNPTEAFYCDDTRLYLHFYNPVDNVAEISEAIKKGLASGKLVDRTADIAVQPAPAAPVLEGLEDLEPAAETTEPAAEEKSKSSRTRKQS